MDQFYMYVSIGALVLLIVILTIIGVAMSKMQSNAPFPTVKNTCPDYWDVSSDPNYCGFPVDSTMKNRGTIVAESGTGIKQADAQNVGMCNGISKFGCSLAPGTTLLDVKPHETTSPFQYIKLNNNSTGWGTMYPGMSEICAQKQWATLLGVSWDGVSNYNGC